MSDKSAIEWTDATWNPTRGCTEIAPGCAHCYAKVFAERFRGVPGHPYELGFDPRLAPEQLPIPLQWRKPRRIFVDSMSDLFHADFPFHYIAACFAVMAITPWHTYQVLTKRPARAVEFFEWLGDNPADKLGEAASDHLAFEDIDVVVANYVNGWSDFRNHEDGNPNNGTVRRWPLANVHFGTSLANQPDANKNVRHLMEVPAAVRILSVEPLIGAIDLRNVRWVDDEDAEILYNALTGEAWVENSESPSAYTNMDDGNPAVDWVIVGGESGAGARPCRLEWIRSIVGHCREAGVPVFVKQLGARPQWGRVGGLGLHGVIPDLGDRLTARGGPGGEGYDEIRLRDRKGGDWSEWPEDLRVRQFPGDPV